MSTILESKSDFSATPMTDLEREMVHTLRTLLLDLPDETFENKIGDFYTSLSTEIEEHLQDGVMVLFDFGNITDINETVLKDIDGMISNVYSRASAVKAICRNGKFFEKIQANQNLFTIPSVLKQI